MNSHLEKAIAAEIAYSKQQFDEQQQRSPQELRKEGLVLFPLQFAHFVENNQATILQFTCSFVINDTYFKRGSLVKLKAGSTCYNCRILDLEAQTITISSETEIEENLYEVELQLEHIPDDRTLKCMSLGLKLSQTLPHLLAFETDFKHEKAVYSFTDEALNPSQQKAVGSILSDERTVVIQGPPGTGKTHTLSLAIAALVKKGKRVIIAAPSNTAVDQLARKVIAQGCQLIRLGNDEKISADLQDYTIDGYLEKGGSSKSIQQLKKQLQQAENTANRHVRNFTKEAAEERRNARKEVREIKQLMRKIAKDTVTHLIETSQVIASTPVGLFNHLSKDFSADVVILDEAGQALEPLAWLVASFGKRLILCGDPQQLPPTVLAPEAVKLGLNISLLERVAKLQSPILLNEQYRMGTNIVASINPYFYQNQLTSASHLPAGKILFVDMAGYGEGELQDEQSGSFSNPSEVEVIQKLIEKEQISEKETVILAPYSAQIKAITDALGKQWKVATVDAIQGQEAATIIISLTRSNEEGTIGFLADYRRTNVAISRAQTSCILIGDSATIGSDKFYAQLLEQLEQTGNYISAWELV